MAPLHAEVVGDGPRLVMAHGFSQTGRLWGPFGEALGRTRTLVLVDLPGHAGSTDVRADLIESGELLADACGSGGVDLLGYSLGARVALHAALARPGVVRRLVLIGATAGIEDPVARAARRRRDDELADDLEASGDLEGFVRRWLAAPMFATVRAANLPERLRNSAPGLASSLRLAGTGTQEPLWGRLGDLTMPVLVLAGTDDPRFAASGRRLAAGLPNAAFSLVPGAGHAAHLQQPGLAARLVDHFLGDG